MKKIGLKIHDFEKLAKNLKKTQFLLFFWNKVPVLKVPHIATQATEGGKNTRGRKVRESVSTVLYTFKDTLQF